jgi:translocator protein
MIEANENIAMNRQVTALIIFIVICFIAAGLGSLATTPKIPNWYANLAKPAWTPPGWVFGPVWTLLYLMMAFAAWLIWRQLGLAGAKVPLAIFAIQLALNSLWSFIFFGLQKPGYAAMEITVFWLAIIATMITFWRFSSLAGAMLIPYLLWVSFAAVLNFSIWRMNLS